jgi:hypothetical protein
MENEEIRIEVQEEVKSPEQFQEARQSPSNGTQLNSNKRKRDISNARKFARIKEFNVLELKSRPITQGAGSAARIEKYSQIQMKNGSINHRV